MSGITRRWRVRATAIGAAMLLLAACTATPAVDGDDFADDEFPELTWDPEAPGAAPLVAVEVAAEVASPGERVGVSVSDPAGATIHLVHAGEVLVSVPASEAAITVPPDASDGAHLVRVDRDGVAVGAAALRVASAPGLWLSADRSFVSAQATARVRLTAHGIPNDAVVVVAPAGLFDLEWDDDDWWDDDDDDWWDDDDDWWDDEPVAVYMPHPAGVLLPIAGMQLAAPSGMSTVAEVADRPLAVPATADLSRGLQAFAFTTSGDGGMAWVSDVLYVERCDERGLVTGVTQGPALVSAVWTEGGPRTSRMVADGPYQLAAGPGLVAVTVAPLDEESLEDGGDVAVEVVDVPCGGVATLASAGEQATARLLSALGGRARSASAPEEPCRRLLVWGIGTTERLRDLAHVLSLWGSIDLQNSLSRVEVVHVADIRALLELEAQRQLLGAEDDYFDISHMVAADFAVPVQVFDQRRGAAMQVRVIRVMDGRRVTAETDQARRLDQLLDSGAFTRAGNTTARAGVCGEVEPDDHRLAVDEEVTLVFEVTDLNDGDADGAVIKARRPPECGELEPEEATVDGREAEMTYTATARQEDECVDNLTFEVEWRDGAPQPVRDSVQGRLRVGGNYRLDLRSGVAPEDIAAHVPLFFAADVTLKASACDTGILGPWEGTFEVDFQLIAPLPGLEAAEGDSFTVTFYLPQAGGRFTIMGIDHLGVIGEYFPSADYVVVLIDGDVLIGGPIESLPEGC